MSTGSNKATAPRDYESKYLSVPLEAVLWGEHHGVPWYAMSMSKLPPQWEPLTCKVHDVETSPDTFEIETSLFDMHQTFEWTPDFAVDVEIPWGYVGFREDGDTFYNSVFIRNKFTRMGTAVEDAYISLYQDSIPTSPPLLTPDSLRALDARRQAIRRGHSLDGGAPLPGGRHDDAGSLRRRRSLPAGAPALGTFEQGGYFFGITVDQNGDAYKNYVAPRQYEIYMRMFEEWSSDDPDHPLFRCLHRTNSRANTELLRNESRLADVILSLDIDGVADWGIPAVDVAELMFRNLHTGIRPWDRNYRDGDNASSLPQGISYGPGQPAASEVAAFRRLGDQAFHSYTSCHVSTIATPKPADYAEQIFTRFGASPYIVGGDAPYSVRPVRRERL